MRLLDKHFKIVQGAVVRVHIAVVRNIVAIITEGRRIKRQKPEGCHPEITQIGQLLNKSLEITDAIAIAVINGPHVVFINNVVLVSCLLWLCLRKLSVSHQSMDSFPASMAVCSVLPQQPRQPWLPRPVNIRHLDNVWQNLTWPLLLEESVPLSRVQM